VTWSPDPDEGPIGRGAWPSEPAWPEDDIWAPRRAAEAPRAAEAADEGQASFAEAADEPPPTYAERPDYAEEPDYAEQPDFVEQEPIAEDADAERTPPPDTEPLQSWDPRRQGERRRPTTAEQAVPWLIGIILALAGMVIVLVALIMTSENGVLAGTTPTPPAGIGGLGSATPSASAAATDAGGGDASASPTTQVSPSASASANASPTTGTTPSFGALDMVYLARKGSGSAVDLWRRDFSKTEDPTSVATAEQGITKFVWSPDGSVGAVVVDGHVVAIDKDGKKRPLVDGADEIAFGPTGETLYVVQIGRLSGKDRCQLFAVDFESGASKRLTDFTYTHPQIVKDPPLVEATFNDEGGLVRLWPTADGNLVLWILGAPGTYRIDPVTGVRANVTRTPTLYSPDASRRVESKLKGSTTTLTLYDRDDQASASVKLTGLVSHLRWAPNGSEVSFTLGVLGRNGGVVQNLYLWDLVDGKAPMQLTSNGTSSGAEWLGAAQSWQP
jgi:hypothetical protein